MITHFKSELNEIKAEADLVSKTDAFLRDSLTNNKKQEKFSFFNRRLFFMKKKLAIAVLAAIFTLGGSTGAFAYYKTPVSYLSVDINPSVEMGVNAFGDVVTVKGYNEDGNKILSGIKIDGLKVKAAVSNLVDSAVKNGFVDKDGSTVVSVTSETDNAKKADKLQADAEEGANEALENNDKTAVVHKDNVALARRDEARTLGITPGKLNLINKLRAVDPTATVEQYKDATVKEIMKNIQKNTVTGNAKTKAENVIKDKNKNQKSVKTDATKGGNN